MASKYLLYVYLIVAVLLQPFPPSLGNFLSPLLSPIPDALCKVVECGKGNCKPSGNSSFPYDCECDAGWKQFQNLSFLPCVIPNCSLDYSCIKGQSPVQEKSRAANGSITDPCHWTDCGGGSCNKTSLFKYNCMCEDGYYNLLNISAFPCFKQCAIGLDCSNLGLSSSNRSDVSPNGTDNGENNAGPVMLGCSPWPIVSMLFLGVLQWS